MINKNLQTGDYIAIRFRKDNDVVGYDSSVIDHVDITKLPVVFWHYNENFTLETYLPLKIQKELHEKYGVNIIDVQKPMPPFYNKNIMKQTHEVMTIQQYYIDPIKKNLGVIEFIRVKHSEF